MEWTVEEDLARQGNAWPTALLSPALVEEPRGRVVFRGWLTLMTEGGAALDGGDTFLLFGLTDPPPSG